MTNGKQAGDDSAWQDVTKADADYRRGDAEENCGRCTMFRPPNSCTLVHGKIKASDVCDYFKAK
jgi:hypothetical protein